MRYVLFRIFAVALSILLLVCVPARADDAAGDERDKKIERLERALQELSEQVKELKRERAAERTVILETQDTIDDLSVKMDDLGEASWGAPREESWVDRFTLGGYGDVHANFGEGSAPDLFDIHRIIIYLGYDFNDWISFNSETELEHALVEDDNGKVLFEQLFLDFLLSDPVNIRLGRVLMPLGIVNQKHEPPSFNGVERPLFAKNIIPSTWFSDGIGVFGSLTPSVTYEAYVVAGLEGDGFGSSDGIRGGRNAERPSLHEPAFAGRVDYFPLAMREPLYGQVLRLGASTYFGGLDNGNKGKNPGVDGDIAVFSADFEYTISKFDFRGAIAYEDIDDARGLSAVTGETIADTIFGWYLEGAYHFMPDSWKKGKLARSDAVAFVRFDSADTQHDVPSGLTKDPSGDREEWTFGVNFYLLPNLVIKADYQIRDDASSDDLPDLFNLGVGWQF